MAQLAAIGGQHRAEQAVATQATRSHATIVDDSLAVDSTKVNDKVEIHPSTLPCERRHAALQRARNLVASVVLLSKDNIA